MDLFRWFPSGESQKASTEKGQEKKKVEGDRDDLARRMGLSLAQSPETSLDQGEIKVTSEVPQGGETKQGFSPEQVKLARRMGLDLHKLPKTDRRSR